MRRMKQKKLKKFVKFAQFAPFALKALAFERITYILTTTKKIPCRPCFPLTKINLPNYKTHMLKSVQVTEKK